MWDQRYAQKGYAYGTEPNDFLTAEAHHLPKSEVLCLAEGEGRNAVWLAEQGYEVTAVDASQVGLEKAQSLAEAHGVSIQTIHTDLAEYDLGKARWAGIVSVFAHMPAVVRIGLHTRCVTALKPGGVMLLEAYTPAQLRYQTGGPKDESFMMSAALLRNELAGLEFQQVQEVEREIREGSFHLGVGAVVQMIARRPIPIDKAL